MLKIINLHGQNVPWFEMSANRPAADTIHFSGANGFPVATYQEFFDRFAGQFHITGADCRATWLPKEEPKGNFKVDDFADDLISAIESQHSRPVIGMGHSYGGLTTLVAAAKRPELFSTLVIIEPAAMPKNWMVILSQFIPAWFMRQFVPLVKGSLNRQTNWPSPEAFYQRYHGHPTFKHFTDNSLREYANHGLRQLDDGTYELIFNPKWEAHIFCNLKIFWNYLAQHDKQTLLIRGEHSNLNTAQSFEAHRHVINEHVSTVELEGAYHLLPHEKPQQTQDIISQWLEKNT